MEWMRIHQEAESVCRKPAEGRALGVRVVHSTHKNASGGHQAPRFCDHCNCCYLHLHAYLYGEKELEASDASDSTAVLQEVDAQDRAGGDTREVSRPRCLWTLGDMTGREGTGRV